MAIYSANNLEVAVDTTDGYLSLTPQSGTGTYVQLTPTGLPILGTGNSYTTGRYTGTDLRVKWYSSAAVTDAQTTIYALDADLKIIDTVTSTVTLAAYRSSSLNSNTLSSAGAVMFAVVTDCSSGCLYPTSLYFSGTITTDFKGVVYSGSSAVASVKAVNTPEIVHLATVLSHNSSDALLNVTYNTGEHKLKHADAVHVLYTTSGQDVMVAKYTAGSGLTIAVVCLQAATSGTLECTLTYDTVSLNDTTVNVSASGGTPTLYAGTTFAGGDLIYQVGAQYGRVPITGYTVEYTALNSGVAVSATAGARYIQLSANSTYSATVVQEINGESTSNTFNISTGWALTANEASTITVTVSNSSIVLISFAAEQSSVTPVSIAGSFGNGAYFADNTAEPSITVTYSDNSTASVSLNDCAMLDFGTTTSGLTMTIDYTISYTEGGTTVTGHILGEILLKVTQASFVDTFHILDYYNYPNTQFSVRCTYNDPMTEEDVAVTVQTTVQASLAYGTVTTYLIQVDATDDMNVVQITGTCTDAEVIPQEVTAVIGSTLTLPSTYTLTCGGNTATLTVSDYFETNDDDEEVAVSNPITVMRGDRTYYASASDIVLCQITVHGVDSVTTYEYPDTPADVTMYDDEVYTYPTLQVIPTVNGVVQTAITCTHTTFDSTVPGIYRVTYTCPDTQWSTSYTVTVLANTLVSTTHDVPVQSADDTWTAAEILAHIPTGYTVTYTYTRGNIVTETFESFCTDATVVLGDNGLNITKDGVTIIVGVSTYHTRVPVSYYASLNDSVYHRQLQTWAQFLTGLTVFVVYDTDESEVLSTGYTVSAQPSEDAESFLLTVTFPVGSGQFMCYQDNTDEVTEYKIPWYYRTGRKRWTWYELPHYDSIRG